MLKKLALTAAFGLLALVGRNASAQQLNMDMSWGIRTQQMMQSIGDANAMAAARAYYNYMLRLRQMGYTGPSLPTGVTAQSLSAANQRLQQAMSNYTYGSMINSQRTYNAIDATNAAITRGCQTFYGPYGRYQVCP